MSPNEYQIAAARTHSSLQTLDRQMLNGAIGLCGEAGEVVEHIKKFLHHHKPLDTYELMIELGDVLWYVALTCQLLNLKMEDVMQCNIDKLKQRWPKGFDQ